MSSSDEIEVPPSESIPQHGCGEDAGHVESCSPVPEEGIPSTANIPLEEEVEESCQRSSTSQEEESRKSNPKDGDSPDNSEGRALLAVSAT